MVGNQPHEYVDCRIESNVPEILVPEHYPDFCVGRRLDDKQLLACGFDEF